VKDEQTLSENWVREQDLAGDASSRIYSRLWNREGQTSISVRYSPGESNQLLRDLEVREWCSARGLRVPDLIDRDIESGWAILEDLGEKDAGEVLVAAQRGDRLRLVVEMIAPLSILAQLTPADLPGWNLPLDRHRLRWELAGFELWFLRHRLGIRPSQTIGNWLDDLARRVDSHPKRICHRDYHLNNLFIMRSGEVGVIDYQDLLVGPDCYDAVSLLEERAMPELLDRRQSDTIRERWAAVTSTLPGWQDRWPLVRAQRGLKVIGTFARLAATGVTHYEPWLEDLKRRLAIDLEVVSAPEELVCRLLD
jgi:aminoglycoside/choline kinase family phosphotransferase